MPAPPPGFTVEDTAPADSARSQSRRNTPPPGFQIEIEQIPTPGRGQSGMNLGDEISSLVQPGSIDRARALATAQYDIDEPEEPKAKWGDVLKSIPGRVRASTASMIAGMTARELAALEQAPPRSPEFEGMSDEEILATRQGRTNEQLNIIREAHADMAPLPGETTLQRGVSGAAVSAPVSALALATGVATRNPAIAAASMFPPTSGQSFGDLAIEALDTQEGPISDEERQQLLERARLHGNVQGLIEVGTEVVPLTKILKPGTPALKRFVNTLTAELRGESIATIGQAIDEAIANSPEGVTVQDILTGLAEGGTQLPETWIATVLLAGGMSAVGQAASGRRAPPAPPAGFVPEPSVVTDTPPGELGDKLGTATKTPQRRAGDLPFEIPGEKPVEPAVNANAQPGQEQPLGDQIGAVQAQTKAPPLPAGFTVERGIAVPDRPSSRKSPEGSPPADAATARATDDSGLQSQEIPESSPPRTRNPKSAVDLQRAIEDPDVDVYRVDAMENGRELVTDVELDTIHNQPLDQYEIEPRGLDNAEATGVFRSMDERAGQVQQADADAAAAEYLRNDSIDRGQRDAKQRGLDTAVSKLLGKAKNAPAVEFVLDEDALPADLKKRMSPASPGNVTTGSYDPVTNRVFLFTGSIKSPEVAAWTAAHEIAGHAGLLGALGRGTDRKAARQRLNNVLGLARQNKFVDELAGVIRSKRKVANLQSVEEALAELAAATRTGDYALIEKRYGVTVPQAQRDTLRGAIERVIQRLLQLLKKQTGFTYSDAQVRDLLEGAWRYARTGKEQVTKTTGESRTTAAGETAAADEATDDQVQKHTAYHGTRHRFDKFRTDKIGSGEGVQAYGYGLYFAESKKTAESYAIDGAKSSGDSYTINGKKPSEFAKEQGWPADHLGLYILRDFAWEWLVNNPAQNLETLRSSYLAYIDKRLSNDRFDLKNFNRDDYADAPAGTAENIKADLKRDIAQYTDARKLIKDFDAQSIDLAKGVLYEVHIDDEAVDKMVDWDKPVDEQPVEARAALFDLADDIEYPRTELEGKDAGGLLRIAMRVLSPREVSTALADAGVPGIKYFDGMSRKKGAGTRNLVVFSDEIVEIRSIDGDTIDANVSEALESYVAEDTGGGQSNPGSAKKESAAAVRTLAGSGTVFGRRVAQELARRQRTSLVGHTITSPEELAHAAQLYRDPRFESLRVFFVDDAGKVVSQLGLTQRIVDGAVAMVGRPDLYFETILHEAKAAGATGAWMQHNHPSGDSSPSMADQNITKVYDKYMSPATGVRLLGHVVINHNRYSALAPDGTFDHTPEGRLIDNIEVDFGHGKKVDRGTITGSDDLMRLAASDGNPDLVTVLLVSARHEIKRIATVASDELTGNGIKANERILQRLLLTEPGTAQLFAVTSNQAAAEKIAPFTKDTLRINDDGSYTSLNYEGKTGSAPLPGYRTTRLTPDSSPEFEYLKDVLEKQRKVAKAAQAPMGANIAETAAEKPQERRTTEPGQTAVKPGERRRGRERRRDPATRKAIDDMTADELREELLTHDVTGIPNRRAYEAAEKLPVQAAIDVDSLKWVNDNMGHESGDQLLEAVADALADETDQAFHISGDEFVVQGKTRGEVNAIMRLVETRLAGATIEIETAAGDTVTLKGLGISYGLGEDLNAADTKLAAAKEKREAEGQRAARGEAPRGAERQPAGRQDQASDTAEEVVREESAPYKNDELNTIKSEVDEIEQSLGPVQKGWAPGRAWVPGYQEGMPMPLKPYEIALRNKTIKPKPGAKPIRREHVMELFQRLFKLKIYEGKPFKIRGALGFFRPRNYEIRILKKGDLEVAAHEVFHWLDRTYPTLRKLYHQRRFSAELKSVSYDVNLIFEGFAEFGRLYMTQEVEAMGRTPTFYDAFIEEAQKLGILDKLDRVQRLMHAWYLQGVDNRAASKIGKLPAPLPQRIAAHVDVVESKFIARALDHLHIAKVIEADINGNVDTDAAWSPYKSLRLLAGVKSTINAWLNYGTYGWTEKGDLAMNGKGIKQIFEPVADVFDDTMAYFVGRRARELRKYGKENLFDNDEIVAMLDRGRKNKKAEAIKQAFDDYREYTGRLLDFAQQSGILNPETRALWEKMYQNYVPFYRVADRMGSSMDQMPTGHGNVFKRLTGGTANLRDTFDNIAQNTAAIVTASMRNMAKRQLFAMLDNSKLGQRYAVRIPTDIEVVNTTAEQIEGVLRQLSKEAEKKAMGEDPDSGALIEYLQIQQLAAALANRSPDLGQMPIGEVKAQFQFFFAGRPPKIPDKDFVLVRGKPVWFQIGDQQLWDMLSEINYARPLGLAERTLGVFSRALRRGVTLDPTFQFRNLSRDTFNAFTMSKGKQLPILDAVKSLRDIWSESDAFKDFLANGGGYGLMVGAEARRLRVTLKHYGRDRFSVIRNSQAFFDAWDKWGWSFELATRLAEYKKIRELGGSRREAAFQGREISTDFAMHGQSEVVKLVKTGTAFWNARLQGLYRLEREMFEKNGRQSTWGDRMTAYSTRALIGLTFPSLIAYWLMKDDDDYKDLPEDVKSLYTVLPRPGGGVFLIPRPFETGAIFQEIPIRMLEFVRERDGDKLTDAMMFMIMETFAFDPTPTALAAPRDVFWRNQTWNGFPVLPRSLEDVTPAEQFQPWTSETFQRVGKQFGVSPIKLEALYRGYLAQMGMYALAGSDALISIGDNDIDEPASRQSSWPVLRGFMRQQPYAQTAYEQQFYELMGEIDTVVATARKIRNENRLDDLELYLTDPERAVLNAIAPVGNDVRQTLQEIRAERTRIYNSPAPTDIEVPDDVSTMTAQQKREELDRLQFEENALFRNVVEDLEGADIEALLEALGGFQAGGLTGQ